MPVLVTLLRRLTAACLAVAAMLSTVSVRAAQTQEWKDNCSSAGCHGDANGFVKMPSQDAVHGKILPRSNGLWLNTLAAFRAHLAASPLPMSNLGAAPPAGLNDATLDAIRSYLLSARDATVSPLSVSFATAVPVGQTGAVAAVITLTNDRATNITYLDPLALGGLHPGDFSIVESCPTRVVPAGSATGCTVTVTFTPRAHGARSALLNIAFVDNTTDPVPLTRSIPLFGTGLAPVFSTPSTSISVATIVGTPFVAATTLLNTGNAPYTLNSLTFAGPFASDYSLGASNTCGIGTVVSNGAPCNLMVRFDPTVDGLNHDAVLTISHTASGSPATISFNGTATAAPKPQIAVSASSLDFASTQLGSTSSQQLTVHNVGSAPLHFAGLSVSGVDASDFTLAGSCATATPLPVAGSPCTVDVSFRPTALGARRATLTITSDASNGSQAMSLVGSGVPVPAPVVALSTATLQFGNQTLGGLYAARAAIVTNAGTADLALNRVTVDGGGFALVQPLPCPALLAPGMSCAVEVRFTPTAADLEYTGSLLFVSNAAGSPHVAALRGRGTARAAPALAWAPTIDTLDFGSTPVATMSDAKAATVTNLGPGGATLSLVNAFGQDAPHFAIALVGCAPGSVLLEGESCAVQIRFTPGFTGAKTATLQVASTGSPPTPLTLRGIAVGVSLPQLTLSQGAMNFGSVKIGDESTPFELRLTSGSSAAVDIGAIATTGPFVLKSGSCPQPPFALAAGASCSLMVSFHPAALGASTGELSMSSDAPATAPVTLSGNGQARPEVSGGGCSIAAGDSFADPTLWAQVLLAAAVLWMRRRRRPGALRTGPES